MSQGWLQQPERGSLFVIRAFVGTALLLGRRAARLILYPGCLYFLLFSVRSRLASRKYLSRVFGRSPRLPELFRHYYTFGAVTLDRVYLLKGRYDLFQTQLHGEEVLQQALDRGDGCLLLGAHFGSFEILRSLGLSKQLEVAMVMYEGNARMAGAVTRAINPDLTDRIIALGQHDSMLKVHERLAQSDWVGLLGDRTLHAHTQLRARFLGEDAIFSTAPFRLALMLKRPVVLMLGLYRGGNRYELFFEKLFEPRTVTRAARTAALEEAVQLYARRIEHYCRLAPFNWFNFYDFWGPPR